MLIDCHTHWHPEWSGEDATDPARWLAVLDQHQVSHAVVLPSRGLLDDTLLEIDNTEIAAACARSEGRMIPFCTVKLWQEERALAEIDRCLGTLGFRGIKFHPWLQGVPINHPRMDDVCERAIATDVPILFHDGTPPFSLPSQVGLLARRHPKATFVLGHCGLLEYWSEAIAVLRQCANVWGCLCSPHPGALRELESKAPRERLCWGSDFGFGTYDLIGYRLGLLETCGFSASVREDILTHNPKRLFKLPSV